LQPAGQYSRVANPARAMLGNLWPSTYVKFIEKEYDMIVNDTNNYTLIMSILRAIKSTESIKGDCIFYSNSENRKND